MECVGHESDMNQYITRVWLYKSPAENIFLFNRSLWDKTLYIDSYWVNLNFLWFLCGFHALPNLGCRTACLLFPRLTWQPWSFAYAMAFQLYSCGLWNTCLWAQSDLELNTKIPLHGPAFYSTCQVGRRIDLWGTVVETGSQARKEVSDLDSCQ